jgi:hypothetical protein
MLELFSNRNVPKWSDDDYTTTNNRDDYYTNHFNLENGFRRSTEPLKICEIPAPNQTYRTPVSLFTLGSQSKAPTNPTHPRQGEPGGYFHENPTDGCYQGMENQMDGINNLAEDWDKWFQNLMDESQQQDGTVFEDIDFERLWMLE